jgi:hypothetical protein
MSAPRAPALSREATKKCSPKREPWVIKAKNETSPKGAQEHQTYQQPAWTFRVKIAALCKKNQLRRQPRAKILSSTFFDLIPCKSQTRLEI